MTRGKGKSGVVQQELKSLPWTLFLVFLILVVAITVSGFFYYQKQKQRVFREQTAQLQAIADLKAAEIEDWLRERLGDAHMIMQNPDRVTLLDAFLRARASGLREESIRQWMTAFLEIYHYENVLLLDRQGKVVTAANPHYTMIGAEGLKAIETARQRRDITRSDLHSDPQMPHIRMDTVAPLMVGNDIVGFVLLRIDPADFLYPMIQAWPTPSPSAETLLVRREGDEVLFLNELRHRKNTALKLRFPVRSTYLPAAQASLGRTGSFSGRDYRDIPVWSVIRPILGTTWLIVAKIDRDEIERPLRRSSLAIFLVALSMILAAAMLIIYFWQRRDVRFRQRQLESLRESEDRFRYVFEAANVAKSITQPAGEIHVNQAFCAMLGYDQEELQLKSWQELTPVEEIASIQQILEPLLKGQQDSARFNKRYIHKNGSTVWGDVSTVIRRDPAGKPLHFITTIIDITKRKQAEDALYNSEKRLKETQEMAHLGHWSWDIKTGVVEWSEEVYRIFQLDPATFTPQIDSILALSPWPEDHKRDQELIRRAIETHEKGTYEQRFIRPDKSIGYYHSTFQGIYHDGGDLISIIGTVLDITERKQAEEKFRASEVRYRRLFESAKDGILILDAETGMVIDVNPFLIGMLGFSHEQFLGKAIWELGFLRDIFTNQEKFLELQERGYVRYEDLPLETAAGSKFDVEFISNMYQAGQQKVIQCNIRDISQRKRTEKELRYISSRNQAMLEAIPDIIMEVDSNKVYTWANHAGIKFFGGDVLGREAAYYFEGEQQIYLTVKPIFNGQEEVIYVESWQRRQDNEKRLLAWWCRVLKDENGNVTGALSSARDITELKRAEDALRESERKFRETVVNLDEGYYSVTKDGILLEHNQAFNRILGFDSSRDLKGTHLPDFWQNPEDRLEYVQALGITGTITNYQINAKTQGGEKITVLASAHLVKGENNQPQRIEGVFMDISQRIRAELEIQRLNEELEQRVLLRTAQLEAANKELEAFSYSVSHDLRAPLRAIAGFSRIILEEYAPKLDQEGKRLLDVITANTRKMGQLIDDLLVFSRLSRQKVASAPVNLTAMANVVLSELKSQEKGRLIEFKINALPAVHGDHSMLQLVLQNLLTNAIKFTRTKLKARIELGCKTGQGENLFYVKDNGVGFDMQYVDKLFGVFQRLHSADEFEGTGVGLAIVQRIIARHGGRVWAESKGGKGATFYFSLPNKGGTDE